MSRFGCFAVFLGRISFGTLWLVLRRLPSRDAYAFEVSSYLVPPPNRSEVLLRVWSACPWYRNHHLDVFCTISRGDSVLEFVMINRGPICLTPLTEHLPSLVSAWSRYVCTVGGCLAPALAASACVLSSWVCANPQRLQCRHGSAWASLGAF